MTTAADRWAASEWMHSKGDPTAVAAALGGGPYRDVPFATYGGLTDSDLPGWVFRALGGRYAVRVARDEQLSGPVQDGTVLVWTEREPPSHLLGPGWAGVHEFSEWISGAVPLALLRKED